MYETSEPPLKLTPNKQVPLTVMIVRDAIEFVVKTEPGMRLWAFDFFLDFKGMGDQNPHAMQAGGDYIKLHEEADEPVLSNTRSG